MAGLRWGIMGAGGIARRFARSLGHVEGASLVALSGRSAVRLDSFAAEFPVDARRRYVSAEDGGERAHQMLVDDPDVDAVYLSLLHGMHERWACRLLRAGKAVLCEKPAVLSAEEAGRVVSAARESGSLFVEAMKPRFMPVRARVRELLASGELGEIRGIEVVHRLDYGDLEGGYLLDPVQGGTLYDLGCYGVAWAEDLLGGAIQVDDVRTRWMVASDGSAVDIADEADLRIGGVPVHSDFAGDAGEYRVECRVTCERGEVSIPMLHRPTGFTVHRFDGPDSSRTAGECIEAPRRSMIFTMRSPIRASSSAGARARARLCRCRRRFALPASSMRCGRRGTSHANASGRGVAMAARMGSGCARVGETAHRVGSDELLAVFAEGDGYISHVLVEDVELAYECANAATFEHAVFRDCLFEQVDLRECTFRDVVLENCRFIGCVMDKAWLNRVDLRDCSAPGLSLLQARIAWVCAVSTDLSYANLSETSIDHFSLDGCRLREAALQRAKLKNVRWDACDLTRIDVFGTPLAGIDVSDCTFSAPVLSSDYRELRGLVVGADQALDLVQLLGVRLAEG